jgi:hypothetical protein
MNQISFSTIFQSLPSPWPTVITVAIAVLSAIGLIWRIFYYVSKAKSSRRAKRLNTKLMAATQVASFTDEQIAGAIKNYVEPDCAQTDPSNESNILQVASVRENVFASVDRYIENGGENRHLLVLADSGMGKTTFCLNYYAREQKKKENQRKILVIIPLGRADAVKQIEAIEQKRDVVLFLDALDEDTAAIHDSDAQLKRLMDASADFRNVIVTCRSQFFLNDGAVPRETGIAYVGPRKAGQQSEYKFHKLYLLPFTSAQILRYIRSQFAWIRYSKRKRAVRMIADIPELSVRPMLLTLIPDLVVRDELIKELWDLYAFMVNSWLERESKWIKPAALLEISKKFAVNIYVNRERRHKEHLTLLELREVAEDASSAIEGAHLTARSLLNRDSEGNFKFAHRSIMEYLFVAALVDGTDQCTTVEWTDLMRQLLLSWGRSNSGLNNLDRAGEIFSKDLRATKLLPLANNLRAPQMVKSAQLQGHSRPGASGFSNVIPAAWRKDSIRMENGSGQVYIFDLTFDLKWTILDSSTVFGPGDGEDGLLSLTQIAHIAATNRAYLLVPPNHDTPGRLPSIEEFVSLWEAEMAVAGGQILRRNNVYWLGDRLGDLSYLACSIGGSAVEHALISKVGIRMLTNPNRQEEQLIIYSVAQRTWPAHNGQLYAALACRVEVGNAETSWHELTQVNAC